MRSGRSGAADDLGVPRLRATSSRPRRPPSLRPVGRRLLGRVDGGPSRTQWLESPSQRKVLLRQDCQPPLHLASRLLGVRQARAERVDLVAEPAEARLLCLEVTTRRYKLAPQRALDLPLLRKALTEFTAVLQGGGEFVALIEGRCKYRRLGVAPLTGAVGADSVGVGAPLPRSPSLAGDCHTDDCNGTRRNVHQRVEICEGFRLMRGDDQSPAEL